MLSAHKPYRFDATLLTALIILLVAPTWGHSEPPKPGQKISITPSSLPPPQAASSGANSSDHVKRSANHGVTVLPGFHAHLFAENLENPRLPLTAPDGALLLAESSSGKITRLYDKNGDGTADAIDTFLSGFQHPYGLAIREGYLYVADTQAVWRVPYPAGGTPRRITPEGSLGDASGHSTRSLAIHPDGTRFYVGIGSRGNIAEENEPRATIREFTFDKDGTANPATIRTYAAGLRNAVGLAFRSGTTELYATINERDGLGDNLVPDYLTRVKEGGFYGWPYSYIGSNPQPGFAERKPELVRSALVPDLLFAAHSAPLGMVFYEGDSFPAHYKGDAFVALHGSWNAAKPAGYAVAHVPFRDGKPTGDYEIFAAGFWVEGDNPPIVWGRPAGLAVLQDGSLIIADDVGGTLWRISSDKK